MKKGETSNFPPGQSKSLSKFVTVPGVRVQRSSHHNRFTERRPTETPVIAGQ